MPTSSVPIQILLVEDNPADARRVKEMLREAEPEWITLTHAEQLREAVGLLQRQGFDAILLDLSLPDSKGLGTFVQAQAAAHDVPIVVLSELMDEEVQLRAVAAGAQDYLIKDKVDSQVLYYAIRYAIERHRIEKALRASQARLGQVLTSSPAVLYATRLTPNGFVPTWVSDNIERLTGHPAVDAIAPTWWTEHIHPDDQARVLFQLGRLRSEGHLSTEYRFRSADGTYRWFLDESRLQLDDTAQPIEVFGAWLDVTEQKEAESALKESEQRFRGLAENVRDVSFIHDPATGRALYLSPAYETVFGQSREYAYSTPNAWLEGLHPDDAARMRGSLLTAGEEQRPSENIFRVVRPDGAVRWIRGRATPVLGESGKLVRIVGIAEDITELRRTQEQLFHSQKLEAVGRLAAGVAHDFNNLLTVIIGYGDLVMQDLKEIDPLRENVDQMLQAASRAAELTKQLLAFSRQQVLESQVLDINALVANMDPMLRRLIGRDVQLKSVLGQAVGAVRADSAQLELVLLNLVVNSRDAMPEGGRLTVETANVHLDGAYVASHEPVPAGSYVMLAVTDTGSGMAEEVLARIFEPFFTTKEAGKGTGLGLATVYGIVRQSAGYVCVESELGKGTTFKIYLPLVAETPEALVVRAAGVESLRGSETVLLVEDEGMVRSLARVALTNRGYVILEAANGAEALLVSEHHREPIHLLATDVSMPGMTGPELAERLKLLRPEIRVLFLSGFSDWSVVHRGDLGPGVGFMQKPFTPNSLARKVRQVLDEGDDESPDPERQSLAAGRV